MTTPQSASALCSSRCAAQVSALDAAAIADQLSVVTDWKLVNGALERSYAFGDYYATIAFVNAVAWLSHGEDHHPDLVVSYNRCTVRYNTHSVGGISRNDFICAARCDQLYGERPPARA
jgi:4a-hydroxytetrahydrobiopterin dehydratase